MALLSVQFYLVVFKRYVLRCQRVFLAFRSYVISIGVNPGTLRGSDPLRALDEGRWGS